MNLKPLMLACTTSAIFVPRSFAGADLGVVLGTPQELQPKFNSYEPLGPELSDDGLTIYFQHQQYAGNADIYTASRPTLESPWQDVRPIEGPVNTTRGEASPAVSPDGLELYFDDGHRSGYPEPLRPEGTGGPDIWSTRWDPESESWLEPTNLGSPINTSFRDYSPNFSADGLELYFASDRPGGEGVSDLWVSTRSSVSEAWGEPANMGQRINGSSNDERPALSPDGRMLVFTSDRSGGGGGPGSLWASTRASKEEDWSAPVALNSINGPYWTFDPDFASDGEHLIYGRYDSGPGNTLWQLRLVPVDPALFKVATAPYVQNFDEALTGDGAEGGELPPGWTSSVGGVLHEDATNARFSSRPSVRGPSIFNAGIDGDSDRTLAVGVETLARARPGAPSPPPPTAPMIQFASKLEGSDAVAYRLEFDLEAWGADRGEEEGGLAAFDVYVDVDTGEGFYEASPPERAALEGLVRPTQKWLDGNLGENRTKFDSGAQSASLPAGSTLRVRWEVPESLHTAGWIFGLDNVRLELFTNVIDAYDCSGDGSLGLADADCSGAKSLLGSLAAADLVQGDLDGDGEVAISDFAILKQHFGEQGVYSNGDVDGDGVVQLADFVTLKDNFGRKAAAVPEPGGFALFGLGFLGAALSSFRRRR